MNIDWEKEAAAVIGELSEAQDELLDILAEKRRHMVANDLAAMEQLQTREQAVLSRLETCQRARSELLVRAGVEGLPSDSIRWLASALAGGQRGALARQINEASHRGRLLQHESLTNWVLAQRTLLHLSQVLEIIATGGRQTPTYGKGQSAVATGALVDRAA